MKAVRAFIAIDLVPEAIQRLDDFSKQLQREFGALPVRWIPVENMHLTLKFLGEVSEENLNVLTAMIRAEASACPPFDLSIGGLGVFPNAKRPRVIWLGVEAPAELGDFQRRIEGETIKLGYPPDKRSFSPHFTLGRVLRRADRGEVQEISQRLDQQKSDFIAASPVEAVHLYKSDLKSTGAVYTHLAAAQLGSIK
jgi:2'-5' RNA ligase